MLHGNKSAITANNINNKDNDGYKKGIPYVGCVL